ncbi:MAG: DUF502 domain-containing protein [Cyanobacteria bacterium P01_D01_bin.73]
MLGTQRLSKLDRLKQNLKNDLIAGLLVAIPLATTIWLTITLGRNTIEMVTRIPKQLNPFAQFNLAPWLIGVLDLLIGVTVPLLVILGLGLMARNIAGQWLLENSERVVQGIPLVGSFYKTLKQLLETLLQDSSQRFRRVVLLEYPRRGLWTLGFVTGAAGPEIQSELEDDMLSVFLPTTPNPTSGWYCVIPVTDVIELSLSVEDAFKILVSGGIVSPSRDGAIARVGNSTRRIRGQSLSNPVGSVDSDPLR